MSMRSGQTCDLCIDGPIKTSASRTRDTTRCTDSGPDQVVLLPHPVSSHHRPTPDVPLRGVSTSGSNSSKRDRKESEGWRFQVENAERDEVGITQDVADVAHAIRLSLDVTGECTGAFKRVPDHNERMFSQVFIARVLMHADGSTTAEFNAPFATITSKAVSHEKSTTRKGGARTSPVSWRPTAALTRRSVIPTNLATTLWCPWRDSNPQPAP